MLKKVLDKVTELKVIAEQIGLPIDEKVYKAICKLGQVSNAICSALGGLRARVKG